MSTLDDINRDVWIPFRQAYAALDLDVFVAIHAPDFVRVELSTRWVGNRDQYAERTKRAFDFATSRGDAFDIAFRFDERVVGDGVAFERGVYRLSIVDPQRSEQVFHGRFNTVLRRTDMGWRLIMDQDDDEGGTVGDDAFDAARALDDTAAFADG